jgi:hypothetical protein
MGMGNMHNCQSCANRADRALVELLLKLTESLRL